MRESEATPLVGGFTLVEGPRPRPDGLYVSDFFTERVLRFPDQLAPSYESVCTVPGRPSGLGFTPDGDLLVVSMLRQQVLVVRDGGLGLYADLSEVLIGRANDMCVDADGRAYVGAFGTGADDDTLVGTPLAIVGPDGDVRAGTEPLTFPNGIALSPDGAVLYVAETYAGRVSRFARNPDGALGARETFVDESDGASVGSVLEGNSRLPVLPDGLCTDVEGGVWMADAKGRGVTRFDAGGRRTDFVPTGGLSTYAVALGGPELRTLIICAAPANGTWDPASSTRSELLVARAAIPGIAP